MKVFIEAIQNVTKIVDDGLFGDKVVTPTVIDTLDITDAFNQIVQANLAIEKAKYPKPIPGPHVSPSIVATTFRLHICQNDSQKPCVVEDL